jgi:hypothetical protein
MTIWHHREASESSKVGLGRDGEIIKRNARHGQEIPNAPGQRRTKKRSTEETFLGVFAGKIPLRFEVEIIYFDVFDNRHYTKASGVFMPEVCAFRIDDNQEAD